MNPGRDDWFTIQNIDTIDSPALVFYKERILSNIRALKKRVRSVDLLRPHVKTNKSADVCSMMAAEGITKFKCATIAEAEMLGEIKARDVLLAYQPVGPKIGRLLELVKRYPGTKFSCLFDNSFTGAEISAAFLSRQLKLDVYIDLNVGMNRTGITPANALMLFANAAALPGISIAGLHVYDGHITDADIQKRAQRSDAAFNEVTDLNTMIKKRFKRDMTIVAGGSPTFPVHAQRKNIECSPGTFIFWDWSYKTTYPEEPYEYAALLIARIISIMDGTTMSVDLGHKSVAAENPLPRVHFLNAPEAVPVSHSEEHMVVKVPDTSRFSVGEVLYGVPVHICPSVALYERASVADHHHIVGEWKITARNKRISI